MRQTFAIILAALAAAALFGVLVHGVLVAAHVSEPAATTVYGVTARRLWAPWPLCWDWSEWSLVGWLWPAPPLVSALPPDDSEPW